MKLTTQELENRQVEMTVEVPQDRLQNAMRTAARRLARKTRIPGFRPGKAPYEVILNKVGEETVFEEALDGLGQEMYREAIAESELEPYAPGTLEEIVSQEPLVLRFTVPLEPSVDLGNYRKIRIPFDAPEISDDDFERTMEELRQSRALIEPADRPAEMTDVVIIDVSGELKEPQDEEDASIIDVKGVEVLVSEQTNWPVAGIADHLIGIEADSGIEFETTFPKDYPVETLREREARFRIKCLEVKSRLVPEWSDDLARSMGDFNDLLELRLKLRENMMQSAQREADTKYTDQVIEAIVEKATLEYPPILLEEGIDELITEWSRSLASQKLTLEDYLKIEGKTPAQLREELLPQAQDRLMRALVLGKIVEVEELEVDEKEIDEQIERMLEPFEDQSDDFRKAIDHPQGRRRVRLDLLTEKAFQRITAIAKGEKIQAKTKPAAKTEDETVKQNEKTETE